MTSFKYRPDIDGLRAIAVLLVLLFHADLGFTGGFVGVDVFFVISGFLITGLILKQQQANTFSLAAFWKRRICRIIPAASLVVAATLGVGYWVLLPSDLEELARSAVAQQLMLSNVFFYQNTGYFAGPSETKALLHTWSLAIEEQFYLVFPFVLVACNRLHKRITLSLLLGIAVASLIYSEWATLHWNSASFFLIPSRMWELLLGAVLAHCPPPNRWKARWLESCAWLGFAGVMTSAWRYSATTSFPGLAALTPCAGAGLIIYANSSQPTSLGRLLSNKWLVFLGLISYSLYLWHWPIFAFLRYRTQQDLAIASRVSAIALTLAFAYVSWRFVETPFRRGFSASSLLKIASVAVASACALLGVSQWIDHSKGLPSRFPEHVQRLLAKEKTPLRFHTKIEQVQQRRLPVLGIDRASGQPADFLVWGDSHCMALGEMLDAFGKEHRLSGDMAGRAGTPPLLRVWKPSRQAIATGGLAWNDAVMQYIRETSVQNVFLIARWALYIEGELNHRMNNLIAEEGSTQVDRQHAKAAFRSGLSRTLDALENTGARVWIVKQVPHQQKDPTYRIARAAICGQYAPHGVSVDIHQKRQQAANSIIESVAQGRKDVQVYDAAKLCFDRFGNSKIASREGKLYRDSNHVCRLGAERLIRPMFYSALINQERTALRRMDQTTVR